MQALAFKTIRRLYPDYPLWRHFAYEYERANSPSMSSTAARFLERMGRRRVGNAAGPRHAGAGRRAGWSTTAAISALLNSFAGAAARSTSPYDVAGLLLSATISARRTDGERAALVDLGQETAQASAKRRGAHPPTEAAPGSPHYASPRPYRGGRPRAFPLSVSLPLVSLIVLPVNSNRSFDVPTVGIASVTSAIRSRPLSQTRCGPKGIDMDSIDDDTGGQPASERRHRQFQASARSGRHGVEEMGDTSRAIRDGLHDDGRRRLAVAD